MPSRSAAPVALHVEQAVGLLERPEGTLDLTDRDGASPFVAAEDIDRAALAELGERDFDLGPPTPGAEDPDDSLDERGVSSVEQSVGGSAVPPDRQAHPSARGREETPDVVDRHDAGAT